MTARRSKIAAMLAAGLSFGGVELARSGEICEDAVANQTNCNPICWAGQDGVFNPTPRGLEVRNTGGWDALFYTQDVFAGDVSVVVRGTFNNTEEQPSPITGKLPHLGIVAHWTVGGGGDGYFAMLQMDSQILLQKFVGGEKHHQTWGTLDFEIDPTEELALELRATDLRDPERPGVWIVEFRAWRVQEGEPDDGRPVRPQLTFEDTSPYTSGSAGLSGFLAAGNPLLFYSVCITTDDDLGPSPLLVRGDANDDGDVNISDPVRILNWLFADDSEPPCLDAANTNGDEAVNIADPVYLLNFLFAGGPPPVAPFP